MPTKARSFALDFDVETDFDAVEKILWLRPMTASRAMRDRVVGRPGDLSEPILKDSFTASEVMEYLRCSHAHQLRYVHELTRTQIRLAFAKPSSAEEGVGFHNLMALQTRFGRRWTPEDVHGAAVGAMLNAAPQCTQDDIEASARHLSRAALAFNCTLWAREMAGAEFTAHEMPFAIGEDPRTRFHGKVDAVYCRDGEWTILDYKTTGSPAGCDLRDALVAMALRYEAQAAIYSIAVRSAKKSLPRAFVLYSTQLEASCAIEPTEAWLDAWQVILARALNQLRRDFREPQELGVAEYEPRACDHCPFLVVCRPSGATIAL